MMVVLKVVLVPRKSIRRSFVLFIWYSFILEVVAYNRVRYDWFGDVLYMHIYNIYIYIYI